jgi:molecular chaperone Hsp31 and glyoxalase 3
LKQVLEWAISKDKFVLSIGHGAAGLSSANRLLEGYKLVAFPDTTEKRSTVVGYLPGTMPWFVGERLEEAGMTVVNKKYKKLGSVHKDRKLITGDSAKAANAFGKLAVDALLESQETQP